MAGFIADGVHLDAACLKVALRAKGMGRVVLVFGCRRVVLAGGDRLAASALRMDRAIGGVMEMAGVPLADAVGMATWVSGRRVYRAASGTEPRPRAE
jgi:N-acetylglucosamine-6-phosphate deacetylase